MDSKQLAVKAQTVLNTATALQAKLGETPTVEQLAEVDKTLGEYDSLVSQVKLAQRIEAGQKDFSEPAVTPVTWRDAGRDEGTAPVDPKAWRSIKTMTPFGEKEIRYNVSIAVGQKDYEPAMEAYLRKGFDGMGPNDRKTLSLGTDTAGGFTAPETFMAELVKKSATQATVRTVARVMTVGTSTVKWPRVNYTTDNKYTSGVRMSWTGEIPSSSTVHRVTDPVFGLIDIPVHTAMASMPIYNDLLEDSAFDMTGIASDLLSEAFVLGENDMFLNGTGAGKPLGILANVASTESSTNIKYLVSGAASAITTSGDGHSGLRINNVYYDLPSQYRQNAVWMMASGTVQAADDLVDGSKRPLLRELNVGNLGTLGEPAVLKGKRILVDEFVPAIGSNTYSIIFGDFRGYVIADRVSLSLQRLTDSAYAELNSTGLLARKRVGGSVIEPYRFRVMKCGTS